MPSAALNPSPAGYDGITCNQFESLSNQTRGEVGAVVGVSLTDIGPSNTIRTIHLDGLICESEQSCKKHMPPCTHTCTDTHNRETPGEEKQRLADHASSRSDRTDRRQTSPPLSHKHTHTYAHTACSVCDYCITCSA